MTRSATALTPLLLIAALLVVHASVRDVAAEAPSSVAIGYVELEDDPRYGTKSAYAGIEFRTLGRPFPGAEVSIDDARTIGQVIGAEFSLAHMRAPTTEDMAATISAWSDERGVHFVLVDLPAEELLQLADEVADLPILLINVSAPDDRLRGSDCRRNIAHAYPSDRMLTDALVQYLVSRNWRDILVLEGPSERDARLVAAVRLSAEKFGAEIVGTRPFVLGNDPRRRAESNVALMTGDVDYDVVFVSDESGEFSRYVPYQTSLPRPVVGSAGLVASAWHWTWHRHGAPQLQHRFEAAAAPRRMNGEAWAAWAAVKAVTQATMRAGSTAFPEVRDYMLGDRINLDGVKGNPMSFRDWDRQLRQPILLATADSVIARAPLPAFLHQRNVLDTLGPDGPESDCRS